MKMELFKLQTPLDVDIIENRSSLYYNKYEYRARFYLTGLSRCYYAKTIDEYIERLAYVNNDTFFWTTGGEYYEQKIKKELSTIDLPSIERFINWRNLYTLKENKQVMIRVEGNTAGVFSNDLSLLKTLEQLKPGLSINYSQVTKSIPTGIKYFIAEPKYKYRAYLKGRRTEPDFRLKLTNFIDRYKGTSTVIEPSKAFREWITEGNNTIYWRRSFLSSAYHFNYNNESTSTLLALVFPGLIHTFYKLEKQPDQ